MIYNLTDTELLDGLLELFNQMEPESPEEVAEELREAGLDPVEVGKHMAEVARKAAEKVRGHCL